MWNAITLFLAERTPEAVCQRLNHIIEQGALLSGHQHLGRHAGMKVVQLGLFDLRARNVDTGKKIGCAGPFDLPP
ncbi:hypothetical protein [Azospirillum sp.]|uniref:hypothetical protein n=1 Tax=Azospirillum sp. TaxID=34012 RepID=UPI002D6C5A9C|nr:hypothetical protein [Azospirillum sp.]HYF89717.1 hypothetical protein [Azospirillum sp.]